ncbi:hypothetical protein IMCC3317_19700 [Kordia antarctica]|uniref:Beta-fructofuranosidase n=1 Tax=Kordia antarctica TaxID=1218801 RepID=A0A7L4ZJE5_9FLAO|nr:hypothetical protein [Kordia antarctica]QHI36607.1 hypothetical protein IMCC3317_19700 [Kordia antarctica]
MEFSIKKIVLICIVISSLSLKAQDLNDIFANCLISDTESNITRENPIRIIAIDEANNRIKTNYTALENLVVKATGNQSWFITQSEEASTIVEILNVDVTSGWITLGETYSGFFNMDEGETLEFFNPFVNYEIINNKPLFESYPTHIKDEYINYIQSGGIIKRAENDYVLLTPVIFGAHEKRTIYYATSADLENWTFHDEKILGSEQIPFAKKIGNVFSTGNPLELKDGTFLVLLGVEQPNGNYTSAYMILNKELKIVQAPQEIKIPEWQGETQNSFPLAITKHKGVFRVLFHRRSAKFIESEIHEITTKNILKAFDKNNEIISSNIIQKAKIETGYLHGKADDASYITFNSELHILLGSEELPSEYLTSFNREYGLMKLENNEWIHDKRSPLIVNPMTIHNKYPEYEWTSDHLGGFISPIFHENYLYLFLTFGTDNPDYLLSGVKVKLD